MRDMTGKSVNPRPHSSTGVELLFRVFTHYPLSVASRQIRGLALYLNTTDSNWFLYFLFFFKSIRNVLLTLDSVSRCVSVTWASFLIPHYWEHCILIKGNNKPLVGTVRKYEEASASFRGTHDSVVKMASHNDPPPLPPSLPPSFC